MKFRSKFQISIVLLIIVVLIGVSGFMSISKDTFVDSLYMTVITMSTVGYGTLHELNQIVRCKRSGRHNKHRQTDKT